MDNYYSQKKDVISFQEICLTHYKRILEISTKEFTGGYWTHVAQGNVVNKSYNTDSRKEFCQAVDMLAYALYAHFDKQMKSDFEKYEGTSEKEKKKEKTKEKKPEKQQEKTNVEISKEKLLKSMELFKDLSCLLQRLDYLGSKEYGEDIADIDLEEDEAAE